MIRSKKNKTLGNILVQTQKITVDQLVTAVDRQQERQELVPLGEILMRMGYVADEDIAHALARQLEVPYIEFSDDFRLDIKDVRLVPETIARKYCMVPLSRHDDVITIVMKDPLDIEAMDTVRLLTNMEVRRAVSTEKKIKAIIDRFYREEAHIEENLSTIVDGEVEKLEEGFITDEGVDQDQLKLIANDAPVVRFVNLLLMQAVRDRASDIHFEPGEHEVTVRLRVDGLLGEVTPPPKSLYQAIVTRIKIKARMDIAERRLPQDGRFKFKVDDRIIDIRVSSLPCAHGEKMVLRVLDRQSLILRMEDIGLDGEMLTRLENILKMPNGIVLLTGPTGSGKTTALYCALNYLKSATKNIQTIEDPIEYLIGGINQMQAKAEIGLTFANGLRSILRQDPDIVMIGEMRDLETAQIAMRASLTGHLVLSTLHTNDAISSLSRLVDMGIEPYMIAATVKLVISQRLVRVVCPKCKTKYTPPSDLLTVAERIHPDVWSWKFHKGEGCKHCNNTGYRGRTGVFEFFEISNPIRDMIVASQNETHIKRRAVDLGLTTLFGHGLKKVKEGVTTLDEVLSVCPLPDDRSGSQET